MVYRKQRTKLKSFLKTENLLAHLQICKTTALPIHAFLVHVQMQLYMHGNNGRNTTCLLWYLIALKSVSVRR